MKGIVTFAVLLLGVVGASSSALPYTICNNAPFVPTSVTLDPDPVPAGSTLHFQIDGTADHTMKGGTFKAEVTYVVRHFSFPLYTEIKNVCERTTCPINKGPVTFTYSKALPTVTPKGSYRVKIEAFDLNDHQELCLEVAFRIVGSSDTAIREGNSASDWANIKLAWQGVEPTLWEEAKTIAADQDDAPQLRVVY